MKEYKLIENKYKGTEKELNSYAAEGWIVAGFGKHQILLEREKQVDEEQYLLSLEREK